MAAYAPDECAICFFKYNTENRYPHVLGECGHTFCKECIDKIQTSRCPTCQTPILISKTVKNYTLIDLLKPQPQESTSADSSLCAFCNINKTIHGCDDCIAAYCDPCWSTIHKIGALTTHQQTPVKKFFSVRCKDHPSVPVAFRCQNEGCGFICSLCAGKFAHEGHKYVGIDDLYAIQSTVITQKNLELTNLIEYCTQHIKNTEYVLTHNEERTHDILVDLEEAINTIKRNMDIIRKMHIEDIALESHNQSRLYAERLERLLEIKQHSHEIFSLCHDAVEKFDKLGLIENYEQLDNCLQATLGYREFLNNSMDYPAMPMRKFDASVIVNAIAEFEKRSFALDTLKAVFCWDLQVTKYFIPRSSTVKTKVDGVTLRNGHASTIWHTADIDNCTWILFVGLLHTTTKHPSIAAFLHVVSGPSEKASTNWFRNVSFTIAVKNFRTDVVHRCRIHHVFNQQSLFFGTPSVLPSLRSSDYIRDKEICLHVNVDVHSTHSTALRTK